MLWAVKVPEAQQQRQQQQQQQRQQQQRQQQQRVLADNGFFLRGCVQMMTALTMLAHAGVAMAAQARW